MKCLILSIEKWNSEVTHLATRGKNIITDPIREDILAVENTCAILITYELSDKEKNYENIFYNLLRDIVDLGKKTALIVPFAHLSSDLGDASEAREFLEKLKEYLNDNGILTTREHFGSDKKINLILNSHPGCVRFRNF